MKSYNAPNTNSCAKKVKKQLQMDVDVASPNGRVTVSLEIRPRIES